MKIKDLVTIAATLFVIALIILYLDPERLLEKIGGISLEILFLLLVLYGLDIATRVLRMHILVNALGYDVGYIPLFYAIAATLFINSATPARAGELVRLHVLHAEYGIPYAEGLAAIVVEHVINIIALLTLAICSFLYVREEYTIDPAVEDLLLMGVILISLLNFFLISMAFWGDHLAPFFRYFGPLQDKLLNFYLTFQQGLAALRKSGSRKILLCVLLSFFVWLFEATMIFFLANELAGSSDVSFVLATLASVTGNLTYIFPILPGSIGTYELAIAVIFLLVGLEEKTGVLIAAVDHLFKVLFLTIIGGYAISKLGVDFVFQRNQNQKAQSPGSNNETGNSSSN